MFTLQQALEPLDVEGYKVRSIVYAGKITVNPDLEQVKIVVIREAFS